MLTELSRALTQAGFSHPDSKCMRVYEGDAPMDISNFVQSIDSVDVVSIDNTPLEEQVIKHNDLIVCAQIMLTTLNSIR